MAEIKVTIPDDKIAKVIDSFVSCFGYQATIDGQPNPQTKTQFTKAQIIKYIKAVVNSVDKTAYDQNFIQEDISIT